MGQATIILSFLVLMVFASFTAAEECLGTGPDLDNYVGNLRDQNGNLLPDGTMKVYLCDIGASYADPSCVLKATIITDHEPGFEGFYQMDINGVVGCDEGKPLYFVVGQEIVGTASWTGSRISQGNDDFVSFVAQSPNTGSQNQGSGGMGSLDGGGSGGGGGPSKPKLECKSTYRCRDISSCTADGKKTQLCEDAVCGQSSYEQSVQCTPPKKETLPTTEQPREVKEETVTQKIPEKFRDLMTGRFLLEGAQGDKDTFFIALIMLLLIGVTAYFYYQEQETFFRKL